MHTFSRTDKCSLFLCQGRELDIIQEDKTYHIRQRHIHLSSSYVHSDKT